MKTLWVKNDLIITSNTLFNKVSHPIKDIGLNSVLCNRLKTKNKKDVTQNIKFACCCVDNIFFPKSTLSGINRESLVLG